MLKNFFYIHAEKPKNCGDYGGVHSAIGIANEEAPR